jgi:hypothetical protein
MCVHTHLGISNRENPFFSFFRYGGSPLSTNIVIQFLAAMSSSKSEVVTLSVRPFVPFFFFSPKWIYEALKPYITSYKNLKPKNSPPGRGQGGGVRIIFFCLKFYLYYLGAHAKIWIPMTTLSGRISNELEREKERKRRKKAGAELCQAQFKLGLAKPAVASHVLASIVSLTRSYAYSLSSSASLVHSQLC